MAKVCPNCELTYGNDDFFCAVDGSPLLSTGADADNLVGTVIADRYRIESIVGEGGMGRVYRARHVRVPREAAIKVLRRALIADPYAIAAFNREARNAASVGDHPNIAAVYDFGETSDGLVFLAMEYIEGETLSKLLERETTLPPRRAVEIVRQIAAGLTAAHELPEPVVHRDLKPDNILLKSTRDGTDWVKVVDFGIAKAVKRETQLLTTPGLVVGTPRFMSPEQLTGAAIDARTDVYALAIIAYRLLTGSMPFPARTPDEVGTIQWALQRLTQDPLPLQQVQPGFAWPAGAQELFDRALARNPDDRTATAAELARSLGRAFGYATPSGVMGAVSDPTRPMATAGATPPRADGAAMRAPSVGAESSPKPVRSAGDVGTMEPGAKRRRSASTVTVGVAAAIVVAVGAMVLWSRPAVSPPPSVAIAPNDTARVPAEPRTPPLAVASKGKQSAPSKTDAKPASLGSAAISPSVPASGPASQPPVVSDSARPGSPRAANGSAAARVTLDEIKAAIADPDAVAQAGNGAAILDRIGRLLPTLTDRSDSVEAIYHAAEVNLILDRPADACRLLTRIRPDSRGTPYEAPVDRYLTNAELSCATRR